MDNFALIFLDYLFKILSFMNVETIGLWAGAVWKALNDAQGTLSVKGLRKATKLKEKEIFAAIGWLAREGKISVESDQAEKEVEVTLI